VDLFRVAVPDNGTLTIDIDTDFSQYVDSYLRVFRVNADQSLTEIASNDDARPGGDNEGHGTDSFLTIRTRRGDDLVIGVSGFGNNTYDPTRLDGRNPA